MPVIENKKKLNYHPTQRRKVLAVADVSLQQVQVVDKKGQIRSVVLWRCGTDVLYASTMEGLFDVAQRRQAPEWLLEALAELPADRQFTSTGDNKATTKPKVHLPEDGDSTPDFLQG